MNMLQLKSQINKELNNFKLREVADLTGINVTRLHRIKHGKEMDLVELYKLSEAFGIKFTITDGTLPSTVAAPVTPSLTQAEALLAAHYGITIELLRWSLTNPSLKSASKSGVA